MKKQRQLEKQGQGRTSEVEEIVKKEEDEDCVSPELLQKKYRKQVSSYVKRKKYDKKNRGTNVPKFFIQVFFNNLPLLPDQQHMQRMRRIIRNHSFFRSKTRFDLNQIFGLSQDDRINRQNFLNRRLFSRMLSNKVYDNILTATHIRNKRIYLMHCKKMLLRLERPELLDRLQV